MGGSSREEVVSLLGYPFPIIQVITRMAVSTSPSLAVTEVFRVGVSRKLKEGGVDSVGFNTG